MMGDLETAIQPCVGCGVPTQSYQCMKCHLGPLCSRCLRECCVPLTLYQPLKPEAPQAVFIREDCMGPIPTFWEQAPGCLIVGLFFIVLVAEAVALFIKGVG